MSRTNELSEAGAECIAERVWRIRGGPRRSISVFLIEEQGEVTLFDAGIRGMGTRLALAASELGVLKRVVLSHAHCDHRGAANELDTPVLCHPGEVTDAQTHGDPAYFDLSTLSPLARAMTRLLHRRWDGGAVRISDTITDGDRIAGFEVIALPGHAPGHIGLWREADRLALVADAFYRIDPTTARPRPPLIPPSAYNASDKALKQSLRRIAAMHPRSAWPSHGPPVVDVESQLSRIGQPTP